MSTANYWIYILRCKNGNYYTGYTTDLVRRYREHATGTAKCKYTRSFKPVDIAQSWQIICDKSTAMRVEKFIKKMSKKEKEQLILFPERLALMVQCNSIFLDKLTCKIYTN